LDSDAIDHASCRIGCNGVGCMVPRAVSASLSDVLGCAFGLSSLAIRRAAGTGGRPHHPKSARSALHRYSDELHVPQRSVVVLFHADPVLFNFSHALSGGAPLGTVVVFVNCMCRRIFRALHVACSLATEWPVGVRRFRDLSLARVCTRNIARHVAHTIHRTRGMVLTSGRWNTSWADPLPCSPAALRRSLRVHFRRFCHRHRLHAVDRRHCWNNFVIQSTSQTFRSSWTLFVRFVSHSPTLRDLARTTHSTGADLGIPSDLRADSGCAWGAG